VSQNTLRRMGRSWLWFAKWAVAPVVLGALVIAGGVALYRQGIDFDTFLNYFALGLLIFVIITLFYGIIAIHDVPYEIARKRDHPHQDAIHAAGWVSLFTLHALWPFLWIWAMLYRPDRGWGFKNTDDRLDDLLHRVQELETRSKRAKFPTSAERPERQAKRTDLPATAEQFETDSKSGAG
jgi:Protein of unknown function (DUF3302)